MLDRMVILIMLMKSPDVGLVRRNITELSICTTDGSYDGKTPNVASSPRRLSGPLRVVALGGPTEDKFDVCAHEWNCYLTVAESIRRQITVSWEENNKEGIETTFKTQVSSVSGGEYYRFDDFVSWIEHGAPAQYVFIMTYGSTI